MRLYFEIVRVSFRRYLTYRAATLAGLFANTVFGVILSAVYLGFYRGSDRLSVAGFSLNEMLIYIWISQALISLLALWNWWEIAVTIKTGEIVSDLMKPFNFQAYWLCRDLGRAGYQFVTRAAATFVIGLLIFNVDVPASPRAWLAFGCSLPLAILVSFGWRFLLNISAFWLLDVRGMNSVSMLVVNFFSGFLIPLTFFPPLLQTIAELLPFRAFIMVPAEVLLGQRSIATALAIQLFWAVALLLLGQILLVVVVRRVVVQGG